MMNTFNRVHWKALSIPKKGSRPPENGDAFLPVFDHHTYNGQADFICALADGAAHGLFSALWARVLVKEAVAQGFPASNPAEMISAARQHWRAEVSRVSRLGQEEENPHQDGLASLLWFGLRFPDPKEKGLLLWRACAVGDTCLFQIRKRAVVQLFPQMASGDFGKQPSLLSANPAAASGEPGSPAQPYQEGRWFPGDGFLLMTAALSAWFVRETEQGNTPMVTLEEKFLFPKERQAKFSAWIAELREASQIKDDDTSILWVGTDPKLTSKT